MCKHRADSCGQLDHNCKSKIESGAILNVHELESRKRANIKRQTFTLEQVIQLEIQFGLTRYLKGQRRSQLAQQLNLTERQVKCW